MRAATIKFLRQAEAWQLSREQICPQSMRAATIKFLRQAEAWRLLQEQICPQSMRVATIKFLRKELIMCIGTRVQQVLCVYSRVKKKVDAFVTTKLV